MPLSKGKSEKTFKHNVKTEYEAGKPLKQSLAIAYSMKKKSKKMAEGGMVSPIKGEQTEAHECDMCGGKGCERCNEEHEHDRHDKAGEPMMAEGGRMGKPTPWKGPHSSSTGVNAPLPTRETAGWHGNSQSEAGHRVRTGNRYGKDMLSSKKVAYEDAKALHRQTLSEMKSQKTGYFAEGGQITDNYNSPRTTMHQTMDRGVDPEKSYDPEHMGDVKRPNSSAMMEDDRRLNQHGAHEEGRQGNEDHYADGGQITDNYADTEDGDGRDMVGRIMAQRQQMFSKGGQVANNTDKGWKTGERRDDMGSGQYDDLVIRDNDMEDADYTGDNSGDFIGDDREDKDRRDIVSRAMKARRMKSSMDGMSGYGRSDKAIK